MRRLMNKLVSHFRTVRPATAARTTSRPPHRASLRVEGLEDRTVLTTATLSGSALSISNVASDHTITLALSNQGLLEVFDNTAVVNVNHLFKISSIKTVDITASTGDQVSIDDALGMPLAQGTVVSLNGTGTDSLTLTGDLLISGNETFQPGVNTSGSSLKGELSVDDLEFELGGSYTTVNDFFRIGGSLDVSTSSKQVALSSGASLQTLTGLGNAGGGTLSYDAKPAVELDENAAGATVVLGATAAASGESLFSVHLNGGGDLGIIQATPSSVSTVVSSVAAPGPNLTTVNLLANAGMVSIEGSRLTDVQIGVTSTQGVLANVSVTGAESLTLSDDASQTAQNVTVTQDSIGGTGLFGNNSAVVSYQLPTGSSVTINTGEGADQYSVRGTSVTSRFNSEININDFSQSRAGFIGTVNLEPDNGLSLRVTNEHPTLPAELFFFSGDGTVSINRPVSGVEEITVNYPGELPSQIIVTGFSSVEE